MDYPFIPLPKWFIPLCPQLNGTEIKLMLAIFDQTIGWSQEDGTRQTTNILAYTFLQNQTGITSRTLISKALKNLESMGLIKREAKRVSGQKIQVSIKSPIVPIELVKNQDSLVKNQDSVSPDSGLTESRIRTHIKNPLKESFKESNTMKFSAEQEESLALIVGVGLSDSIARQLISKAWSRGRDISYIRDILGYVTLHSKTNIAGMVRVMISQNSDVNPPSKEQQSQVDAIGLSKWAHGGKAHRFVEYSCEICHPEIFERRRQLEEQEEQA